MTKAESMSKQWVVKYPKQNTVAQRLGRRGVRTAEEENENNRKKRGIRREQK
jgi:hypothetical protein